MCYFWYNLKDMYIILLFYFYCKFLVWNIYILWRNSIIIFVYEYEVVFVNKKKEIGVRKVVWKKYF